MGLAIQCRGAAIIFKCLILNKSAPWSPEITKQLCVIGQSPLTCLIWTDVHLFYWKHRTIDVLRGLCDKQGPGHFKGLEIQDKWQTMRKWLSGCHAFHPFIGDAMDKRWCRFMKRKKMWRGGLQLSTAMIMIIVRPVVTLKGIAPCNHDIPIIWEARTRVSSCTK